MVYVFLPCDDGKFENEGLKVEENGRLVQRDVTLYLLSTRWLQPFTHEHTGGMFSSQKEALTSSYKAILRVHVVHTYALNSE